MADDGKILVEIVLDDGSIQKGFAKIRTESKKTGDDAGKNLSTIGDVLNGNPVDAFVSKLKEIPVSFVAIGAAAVGIGLVLKKAFDLTIEGEKLNTIETQFNTLAQSAGLSGSALQAAFDQASGGLADTTDILQIANQGLINLGASAARLPEVLDLARRVTLALGGDLQQRFAGITSAIETGNARALRSQGIILDADKALAAYAKTIGVSAGELTIAQRQQAILNAAIEQGNEKFKDINTSIQPIQDNLTRFRIALNDLGEAIAKIVNSSLGSFFTRVTEQLAGATKAVASFIAPTDSDRIEKLTNTINSLKFKIFETTEELNKFSNKEVGIGATLSGRLVDLNKRLSESKSALAALNGESERSIATSEKAAAKNIVPIGLLTNEQIQGQIDRQRQIDALSLQSNQFKLQQIELQIQAESSLDQKALLQKQQYSLQLEALSSETANKLLAINTQFSEKSGFTDQQREEARLALTQQYQAQLSLLQTQYQQKVLKEQIISSNQLKAVMSSGLSQTFQTIGQQLINGGNLFETFGNGVVGIIADMIISVGNALIVQGLAIEAFVTSINSLLPGSGASAAAAGLGLVLFGSALKAAVGSRSNNAVAPPSPGVVGGGVVGGGFEQTPVSELTPAQDLQRNNDTSVVINVNGDILDSDETGSRIVSLINDAFDKKGVQVRRGAVA